ncbi:hypothetical protein PSACC_03158, partial [Paramicrosporidium saccamoebae]
VQFIKLLRQGLNSVINLGHLRGVKRERVAEIFSTLLNGEDSTADLIISNIKWFDTDPPTVVPSLFNGRDITAQKVFASFLHALNPRQLSRFVAVWTGSELTIVEESTLRVQLSSPGEQTPNTKKGLWADEGPEPEDTITAGPRYIKFIQRVAKLQAEMLGISIDELDMDALKDAHQHPSFSSGVRACFGELGLIIQPAVNMIQSLVELLNVPPKLFFDQM